MSLPHLIYTLNGKAYAAGPETLGLSGISLITQIEENQVFYRTKWQGDIVFCGIDYTRFWELFQTSCCQPVPVSLYKTGASCGESIPWKGVFILSDLEFNVEAGTAQLTTPPRPNDGYQTLLEKWETKVNWLDISIVESIFNADRTILYRRARALTRLLGGMVNLTLKDTAVASLIPNYGPDTISVFLESALNPVTRQKNPLQYAVVVQASDVASPGKATDPARTYGFATKAELSLKELVDDLQELLCLYPYIDPLTGKLRWEHESFFPYLSYDAPQSGFSLPESRPEWRGHKTIKTDTTQLYGQYVLTIEPNQALSPSQSEDTGVYQFPVILNNPYGLPDFPGANQVDSPTIPVDFAFATIEFNNDCVNRQAGEQPLVKQRSVQRIATYTAGAVLNAGAIDKGNWLFLMGSSPSTDPFNQIPQIPYGVLDTHGVNAENGALSASSLVRDFHRDNKPFFEGIVNKSARYLPNGIRLGMRSQIPIRQLGAVTVAYCCADSAVELAKSIQTWLADDGVLQRAEHRIADDLLVLTIAHPSHCQTVHSPPFDPNGNPTACKPKGTFLRIEQLVTYPDNNTSAFPCKITVSFIYADGACGEYAVTNITDNGTC